MVNILTGDRPTGCLHLGHYVGSLQTRITLQKEIKLSNKEYKYVGPLQNRLETQINNKEYKCYILLADTQGLTDNFANLHIIKNNIIEILKDYIAVGIDPETWCIFAQSKIHELFELTIYLMNLATFNNLSRIPTLKVEIQQKGFDNSIPMGFLNYPISQAADILLFHANLVPAGEDQSCLIEFANELAQKYNNLYCKNFQRFEKIKMILSNTPKLIGIDGKLKASKTLNNAILLSDCAKTVQKKVQMMYTDPNHILISDPGQVEGNVVFSYLDAFYKDKEHLDSLKEHYKKGGLGDSEVKKLLQNTLNNFLDPIREKRSNLHNDDLMQILENGTKNAKKIAEQNIANIRKDLMLNYL